jgi:hypothetical protein
MTDFTLLDQSGVDIDSLKQQRLKNALQYEREKTALKYYLIGKGYNKAIKALGYIERIEFRIPAEERFRKDKVTPSLHHQIRIALSVTQLKGLTDKQEELCIVAALLHDVQEDHSISYEEIYNNFGKKIAEICWKLTKKFVGQHKNKEEYIREIGQDLIASIVKGLDRNDNLSTMIDVFSISKMDSYADEAEDVFLPMLKTASKLFPELLQAYQMITLKMKLQIGFTRKYVNLAREKEKLDHELFMVDGVKKGLSTYADAAKIRIQELTGELEDVKKTNKTSEDKKKIFSQVTSTLKTHMMNHQRLDTSVVTQILLDVAMDLGLSTLELTEFTEDRFSNGQTAATWLQDSTKQ